MMLAEQLQHDLHASPHHHQSNEDGEVLGCAPATLESSRFHDFFQVTTMAVLAGRAASGRITSSACSA